MSYSIETAFLALKCKYFHVPWVIQAMYGCLFWSADYLLLIPWKEDAASDENNPFAGGRNGSQGASCPFLLKSLYILTATNPLQQRWGRVSHPPKSAVEVALQSVIVCHALVTLFVTCPSTRLSNDSAFIDIPNGHRRGRLVAILQESVKNRNGATRLGRKAVRVLTENC